MSALRRAGCALAAASIAVTGVGVTTIATATAAEAVPYKMPRGTWGATTYFNDVHAYWSGDAEVRFQQHNQMWWNGHEWVEKQRYFGYYYSGVTQA